LKAAGDIVMPVEEKTGLKGKDLIALTPPSHVRRILFFNSSFTRSISWILSADSSLSRFIA
jgi:hypothetical protein